MKTFATLAGLILLGAPLTAAAQSPGVSCQGENYLFSGTCVLPSQCATGSSDSSASCSGGYVCCSSSLLGGGGGGGGGGGVNNQYLNFYKDTIVGAVNDILVPILIAIAFIVFLWGVFKYYIYGATDETKRKDGHQLIIWGVIGFVVIVSVWGIVNIVTNILLPGTASTTAPPTPRL